MKLRNPKKIHRPKTFYDKLNSSTFYTDNTLNGECPPLPISDEQHVFNVVCVLALNLMYLYPYTEIYGVRTK